ncbi:MAG: hypothetical protein ACOZF0_08180 [Thermodesulfobacteriota bacterium]
MKLWSRGLGRTEVLMDFRYYKLLQKPGSRELYIIGRMRDPVNWEFRITLQPEDLPGFMRMFFHLAMLKFIFRNIHRCIIDFFQRNSSIRAEQEHLEERVDSAYEQVMSGGRTARRPLTL